MTGIQEAEAKLREPTGPSGPHGEDPSTPMVFAGRHMKWENLSTPSSAKLCAIVAVITALCQAIPEPSIQRKAIPTLAPMYQRCPQAAPDRRSWGA
jgi:hypothetical protein